MLKVTGWGVAVGKGVLVGVGDGFGVAVAVGAGVAVGGRAVDVAVGAISTTVSCGVG